MPKVLVLLVQLVDPIRHRADRFLGLGHLPVPVEELLLPLPLVRSTVTVELGAKIGELLLELFRSAGGVDGSLTLRQAVLALLEFSAVPFELCPSQGELVPCLQDLPAQLRQEGVGVFVEVGELRQVQPHLLRRARASSPAAAAESAAAARRAW